MTLNRFIPLLVFFGIGYHGTKAAETLYQKLTSGYRAVVAQHSMRILLRVALYESLATPEQIEIPDFAAFARKNIQITDDSDPALDPWGSLLRFRNSGTRLSILSAGPDKLWNTADDLVVSGKLAK